MCSIRNILLTLADELQRPFEEVDWGERQLMTTIYAEDITRASYEQRVGGEADMAMEDFWGVKDISLFMRGYDCYTWEQMESYIRAEGDEELEYNDVGSGRDLCQYLRDEYDWGFATTTGSDDWFGPDIDVYYGLVGFNNFVGVFLVSSGCFIQSDYYSDVESVDEFIWELCGCWSPYYLVNFEAGGKNYSASIYYDYAEKGYGEISVSFPEPLQIMYLNDNAERVALRSVEDAVDFDTLQKIFGVEFI